MQQQHKMIAPMMMSTVLLLDLSGSEIKVELLDEWSFIGLDYMPSSYIIVSPYIQPALARQAQQQQMSTTATMAMMSVVLFFLGSASGIGVGSKFDMIPPLG
jgi:hypothetical protein